MENVGTFELSLFTVRFARTAPKRFSLNGSLNWSATKRKTIAEHGDDFFKGSCDEYALRSFSDGTQKPKNAGVSGLCAANCATIKPPNAPSGMMASDGLKVSNKLVCGSTNAFRSHSFSMYFDLVRSARAAPLKSGLYDAYRSRNPPQFHNRVTPGRRISPSRLQRKADVRCRRRQCFMQIMPPRRAPHLASAWRLRFSEHSSSSRERQGETLFSAHEKS